ncbi:uncharacterized protein [Apostichopus japonicus]|uniref:uncharacterized protein n=1 Tax=Stichopus japonicus TaxID=307972 RepID=UPI003AB6621E
MKDRTDQEGKEHFHNNYNSVITIKEESASNTKMEIVLTVILLILYGFISTEGAPTHQTVENKDASICYSHHRTSDRSSIFRQTSCHGDHDLEVPPDSSIVTSLLNFIPDRHYQDVNERTVGTPCDSATEHRLLNMTQENSTTKERVNTADAVVTHITALAQHDTAKSSERPDSTTTESVKTAVHADVTHITTLAQHDTTKSTERPDYTTEEIVKTAAHADVTHITILAQHDTTKSTERPDSTTKESVKRKT